MQDTPNHGDDCIACGSRYEDGQMSKPTESALPLDGIQLETGLQTSTQDVEHLKHDCKSTGYRFALMFIGLLLASFVIGYVRKTLEANHKKSELILRHRTPAVLRP